MTQITYDYLLSQRQQDVRYSYSERDTLLYALAIGMGRDPFDRTELEFVYERRGPLRVVPSQAIVLARHNLIYEIGLAVEKMLHAEQKLVLHCPLPTAAELVADHRIVEVYDKGAAKGIMIETESRITDTAGKPLFDIFNLYYARGDGGSGGTTKAQTMPRPMPTRAPDITRSAQTLPFQALLYRLTGDRNVIHADPDIAQQMGFKAPILHGSGTLGIACREVLAGVCNYDPARMKSLATRFTAVVYPGERIETDIWIDGKIAAFRCRAPERGVTVLDHGECEIA